MNYIAIEEFKDRYFAQSKYPSLSTIRRLCEKQELPGRKIGKCWFLDVEKFEANGNPLLYKIISNAKAA